MFSSLKRLMKRVLLETAPEPCVWDVPDAGNTTNPKSRRIVENRNNAKAKAYKGPVKRKYGIARGH